MVITYIDTSDNLWTLTNNKIRKFWQSSPFIIKRENFNLWVGRFIPQIEIPLILKTVGYENEFYILWYTIMLLFYILFNLI